MDTMFIIALFAFVIIGFGVVCMIAQVIMTLVINYRLFKKYWKAETVQYAVSEDRDYIDLTVFSQLAFLPDYLRRPQIFYHRYSTWEGRLRGMALLAMGIGGVMLLCYYKLALEISGLLMLFWLVALPIIIFLLYVLVEDIAYKIAIKIYKNLWKKIG